MEVGRKEALSASGISVNTGASAVTCKRCKSKVVNYIKCSECSSTYHLSCAKLINNVIISEENKLICCNKKEVTVECHNLERADLTQHGDENKNVIVESELHLFDALNEVGCDEKNMDIRIVKYVIGQKDFALRQKDEVIKLKDEMIFQLQERIKLLMDHLKLLNKVNIESELSEHARHNTHIKCRENNVDPANSAKEDNSDIFIGNKVKVVSDSETKTSSDIDTTSDVSNEIKEPKSTRTDFVKNKKVRLVQKPTLCGKLVHSQEEEEETLENGASDKPNNQLEGEWTQVSYKSKSKNKSASNMNHISLTKFKQKKEFITGNAGGGKLGVVEKLYFLFVSRLDPEMECCHVLEYLNERKPGKYEVEKLKTKYPNYSSFKVGIPSVLIDEIYSPDFWPSGAFISKFYFPKDSLNYKTPKDRELT